jgi:hypothetical protein
MTAPKAAPKSRSGLKGRERERNFFDAPEEAAEALAEFRSRSRAYRPERNFWPPKVQWARERGWLRIQDPVDGSWFEIYAKGAPTNYVRLAQIAREERKRL